MKFPKKVTAEEAVEVVKSGDHIHLSAIGNAPQCLIEALMARGRKGGLKDVHIHHFHTEGPAPYSDPEFEGVFFHEGFFIGANVRKGVQAGYADYIPVFLGEAAKLYRTHAVPCDVAFIQVCPPDEHGYVSLGTSVDASLAAMEVCKTVVAVVNKYVPRAFGDAMFPIDKIDYIVEDDRPLIEKFYEEPNETDLAIGKNCAELIEDGSCLQMGIGNLPNATLACLRNHKDLGVHTEMFADGVVDLVRRGVITGKNKKLDTGKIVSTFLLGSNDVYNFVNNNPEVLMQDVAYTNDPFVIAQQPKMVAINSAIEIDLTGQVCADSIGVKQFSGSGGQIDFVYGASRSEGGKAIIAMPSMTKKGKSKIVPTLTPGASVVTTRFHLHWFVTENGAVDLYGKGMQERAKEIIKLADPSVQEELDKAAFERFGSHYRFVN